MGGASLLPIFILLIVSSSSLLSAGILTENYYQQSCPQMEKTIEEVVSTKQIASPTTAAATVRLFFHDCVVEGCDASIFISSNASNKAERDNEHNLNLAGDAFDVIVRAKTALELACPGIVSCSDIIAVATRNLINMVGGPFYKVLLGRKDGLVSMSSRVDMINSTATVSEQIKYFADRGFTVQEMVALLGAHTIGFAHCKEFAPRIFNNSQTSPIDPMLNPRFAGSLQNACKNYQNNPNMAIFLDVVSPGKFDNNFFKNMPKGMTLLKSDNLLIEDPRTKPFVLKYGADQDVFYKDFAAAMEKLSVVGIKTGPDGEVRRRCDAFNNVKA